MKIYNQTNFKNKELGNKRVYNMKEWGWHGNSSLIVVFGYYFHSSCGCMLKWSTCLVLHVPNIRAVLMWYIKYETMSHIYHLEENYFTSTVRSLTLCHKPFWFFHKVVATLMIFKANFRIQKGDFFRTRLDVFTFLVIYKFTTWHTKAAN